MTAAFISGLALLLCGVIYFMLELFDLVVGRRTRERIRTVAGVLVLGSVLIAPKALTTAIDWYANYKTEALVQQIDEAMPTTTSTTSTTTTVAQSTSTTSTTSTTP